MTDQERAVLYARKTNANDGVGVANQLSAGEKVIRNRGWELAGAYVDEGRNATDGTRGARPDYDQMMTDAGTGTGRFGEFQHIVPFHTSRLWRNRVERAQGIEILRRARVSVDTASGPSLDMQTAYGRGQAAMLGEFDSMEGEIREERQALAFDGFAERGEKVPGGRTGFGFRPLAKGDARAEHEPAEAAAVRDGCQMILAGATMSDVMRDWNERGLTTRQSGLPFTEVSVVKMILTNPRNAGLLVRRGEVIGTGNFDPIVPRETWEAVCAKLALNPTPARGLPVLLSGAGGAGRCACGNYLGHTVSGKDHGSRGLYRCNPRTRPEGDRDHVQGMPSAELDAYVTAIVLERLSRPDVAGLLTERSPEVDPALVAELTRLEVANATLLDLAGTFSADAIKAKKASNDKAIAAIRTALAAAASVNPLAPFAAGRAEEVWSQLDVSQQRQVVAEMVTVTVQPVGAAARTGRRREFDPELVSVLSRVPRPT